MHQELLGNDESVLRLPPRRMLWATSLCVKSVESSASAKDYRRSASVLYGRKTTYTTDQQLPGGQTNHDHCCYSHLYKCHISPCRCHPILQQCLILAPIRWHQLIFFLLALVRLTLNRGQFLTRILVRIVLLQRGPAGGDDSFCRRNEHGKER